MIAAYVAAIIICGMKGKPWFVFFGLFVLPVAAVSLWPVISAIRVAKPFSIWARRYYGPEKMQIARTRFPKAKD